ncbi:hypothetical protein M9411_10545 [Pasteurella multocida]|uniref:hypothetical protein n=1 Tax=Pasteurella multocida TaxID=747 RepID=UPI000776A7AF|nr:hypothetical protein [Pasteurella multocida]AMM82939.1 hypothetical protein AW43_02440 [Pasteurella multocida subsp. multocida PMTB2.1]AWB53944.1 hypothetical protein DB278_10555 [Pasteurella multocida]URJ85105.1 hypothetical protein M9411_10545 [Pasteurella multocida]HDR1217129.1 hypothetical protein [Pasteurella multocida]HDR1806829.1 hypothetical protein [Pasteurella multocida]
MRRNKFSRYIASFIYYFLFSTLVMFFLIFLKSIYLIIYGLFLGGDMRDILPFVIDRYDFLIVVIVSILSGVLFPFLDFDAK